MIKQLCTIGALALGTTAFGQAVPNGDFENWNDMGLYEDPQGWATFNFFAVFGGPETVTRSTNAHGGNYSARLETVVEDFDGDGNNDTLPGVMYLGLMDFLNEEMVEGAPFSERPDSLTGWFHYLPAVSDAAYIELQLTRWNSTDGMQESVGGGELMLEETTDWSRFSLPIEYLSEEMPDTVRIMMIANTMAPSNGSELFVDDFAFVTNSTASAPELQKGGLIYYPNPANASLTVVADQNETIEVYNALGKLVATVQADASEKTIIATDGYYNGVYFLKTTGGKLHRFVVQH